MNIRKFRYHKFNLPLKKPFTTSVGPITERTGFLIELIDEKGNNGFGEAVSLEDFGSDTLSFVESEISNLNPVGETLPDDFSRTPTVKSRSLQFATDQAILQISMKRNVDISKILNVSFRESVKINAVMGERKIEDNLNETDKLISSHFTTLKIKVGINKFDEELRFLKDIYNNYFDVNLRLDVNGKWTLEEAKKNIERLVNLNIQFIEQPVSDTDDLISLAKISPIPICADESVRDYKNALDIINTGSIKFIVIKPSLLGGIREFFDFKIFAEEKNVKLLVSSAFESAVGNSWLVMLASTFSHDFTHGLGTQSFFEKNTIENPFPIENGKINFSLSKMKDINPGLFN